MYEDHKENWSWNLGSEKVFKVKYGVLEKFVWVLQKSCKSPWNVFLKKGKNPVITLQYGEARGHKIQGNFRIGQFIL